MSVKEIIQLMLPRSLEPSRQLSKLIEPLNSHGISDFSYAVFQDFPNKKRCRTTLVHSCEKLLGSYMDNIQDYSEDAFVETQNFPLHKNAIFSPKDPRYLTHHSPLLDLYNDYGISNEISLCIRDTFLNRTELFWFYGYDQKPDWFLQRLDNIPFLFNFILYFKEKTAQLLSEPFVHENEIQFLLPDNMENVSNDISENEFNENFTSINKYHFGHPFIAPLSAKEFEILKLYFLGITAKEIAINLYISARTVEKHLENILAKTTCLRFKELRLALFRCPLFYNLACYDKKPGSVDPFQY